MALSKVGTMSSTRDDEKTSESRDEETMSESRDTNSLEREPTHQSANLSREPTQEEKTAQAVHSGHDADIPSSIGYILNDEGERKRQASIASRRHSTAAAPFSDAENGDVKPEIAVDDENTVFWDGDDDPQNPYNWPTWLKVVNCILVSALTFVTPLASSMFAPGVPELMEEFEADSTLLGSFCVSVYVLGFAAGPMIFAPMSELYGRSIVYHVCNVGFISKPPS